MKLGSRISLCVSGLVALALAAGGVALWGAWETNRLMREVASTNLPSVRAAEEIEIALLEQSVAVAAFLLGDGDRSKLSDLERTRTAFDHWTATARAVLQSHQERERLDLLLKVYRRYDATRARAVDVYDDGNPAEARRMLDEMSRQYREAFDLCEQFIAANEAAVVAANRKSDGRIRMVILIVGICEGLTVITAVVLLWFFFAGVLLPLRSLAGEVRERDSGGPAGRSTEEELHLVGEYLRRTMIDMQDTKSALEKSRAQQRLNERLASVGKLAASVAHEIRNPLTAMKAWLFSAREMIGRGREDAPLERIDAEIRRLENVVRHFLEFARPPELRLKRTSLRAVIDDALELAAPPAAEKAIRVECDVDPSITVRADRDQLIQVFSNLFFNALQATAPGGKLTVATAHDRTSAGGRPVVNVRIVDTGTGIAPEHRERLFEPFFSTRSEGTGLGLCIAASITAAHAGRLTLESTGPDGSEFVVQLPLETE